MDNQIIVLASLLFLRPRRRPRRRHQDLVPLPHRALVLVPVRRNKAPVKKRKWSLGKILLNVGQKLPRIFPCIAANQNPNVRIDEHLLDRPHLRHDRAFQMVPGQED